MWLWCIGAAWAVDGGFDEPPELIRVASPDVPGALARTLTHSLLAEPPDPALGLDWHRETMAVPDGWPGRGTVDVMNTDLWHDAGYTGQGVKVAIFDIQWTHAEADAAVLGEVQTADCWLHPSCEVPMDTLQARFGFETGSHGYACAAVVRDVAPDAEISLVRVNGFATFESAANWAIRHDIDVISMSMSFFNESMYDGTGPFAAVMRRLEANGILLVSSSGNYARQHWSGRYVDADADGMFDFDGEGSLPLVFRGTGRRTVFLQWGEHHSCGLSDLDAWILDPNGDIVGRSERRQSGQSGCDPFERVTAEVSMEGEHRLVVFGHRVATSFLEVDVFATSASVPGASPGYSMTDPATHPLVFTVGAVRAEGYLDNDVEGFSSQGPVRSRVPKPEIAGPDGLSGPVYGAEGFFGTSAATPAVAGAVALVMGRYPELTPRQAAERLQGWAWSDTQLPHDPRWGAGKARLPVPEVEDRGCGAGRAALLWPFGLPWLMRRRRPGITPRRAAE